MRLVVQADWNKGQIKQQSAAALFKLAYHNEFNIRPSVPFQQHRAPKSSEILMFVCLQKDAKLTPQTAVVPIVLIKNSAKLDCTQTAGRCPTK